jgi:hypothetical protein
MYEGFKWQVLHEGKLTEYIEVTAGVGQGCILSPTIFLLALDGVMRRKLGASKREIEWGMRDRLDGLDFADDIYLLAQRFRDMEEKLRRIQEEAKVAGLNINVNKTKEMRVNATVGEKLFICVKEIEQVDSFTYLGSTVSKDRGADEDVRSRIRKANGAFIQLYSVWRNHISKRTKLRIFNTNVKSVLLYACETWKVTHRITNRLQGFINRCLRCIINIRLPEIISNEDLW